MAQGRAQRGSWPDVSGETSGMLLLAYATLRALLGPLTWVGEATAQAALIVRRCLVPLAISAAFFIFGVGVMVAAGTLRALGAQDRLGQGVSVGTVREFAAWVTGMLVAGIAGTAICSDLGARRVREELDAMAVLAVDPVRSLVLPRFLALAAVTPLLYLWTIFCAGLTGAVGGWAVQGLPIASYLSAYDTLNALDVFSGLLKMALTGVCVATICCYKGLTASGGPEGVGRSVNRAVVLAFVAVWVLNFCFNAIYLGLFPDAQALR